MHRESSRVVSLGSVCRLSPTWLPPSNGYVMTTSTDGTAPDAQRGMAITG